MDAVVGEHARLVPMGEQTAVLGGLLWLCQHSPLHRHYPVGMLVDRVAGSVELNQYRYYVAESGHPVGFCNWALLCEADLARALAGDLEFGRAHWRSGDHFFFPELIAPFGHCRRIIRDIRTNIVPSNVRCWSVRGQIHDGASPPRFRTQRYRNNRLPVADRHPLRTG